MNAAVGSRRATEHRQSADLEETTGAWDVEWDDEADVVCADAGLAGLATAISAVDEGVEVFVAGAPGGEDAGATDQGWFTLESGDGETMAYLAELIADLDGATHPRRDDDLPIRCVREPAAPQGRKIAPFVGPRLRDWTAECIASASGYLYTRVTDWTSSAMESGDGDAIEVTEIGSMTVGSDDVVGAVLDWLGAEAHMRGVRVYRDMRLERLVFGEGQVVGAVFMTSDGPFAVRARHGVLFCRAGSPAEGVSLNAPDDAALRVALVSKLGSRFGRVELLTSDPAVSRVRASSPGSPSGAFEHA